MPRPFRKGIACYPSMYARTFCDYISCIIIWWNDVRSTSNVHVWWNLFHRQTLNCPQHLSHDPQRERYWKNSVTTICKLIRDEKTFDLQKVSLSICLKNVHNLEGCCFLSKLGPSLIKSKQIMFPKIGAKLPTLLGRARFRFKFWCNPKQFEQACWTRNSRSCAPSWLFSWKNFPKNFSQNFLTFVIDLMSQLQKWSYSYTGKSKGVKRISPPEKFSIEIPPLREGNSLGSPPKSFQGPSKSTPPPQSQVLAHVWYLLPQNTHFPCSKSLRYSHIGKEYKCRYSSSGSLDF